MTEFTFLARVKEFIGGVCFGIFLWSIEMTDEEYWHSIYEQESSIHEPGN